MKLVLEKSLARVMDGAMCGMMNVIQGRRRDLVCSSEKLDLYLASCSSLTRDEFYHAPALGNLVQHPDRMAWESPVQSGFTSNDRTYVDLFCPHGPKAPTVLLLHALMSASDTGYRKVARWFNDHGWNAVFPHLPFHYSRKPPGYFNGELAVSADLIRNGETIRQAVSEIRQLINHLRDGGCEEFGILGTSFGGWNGALVSFLEPDLRFLAMIQPIVNTEHAIWENPGSASLRRLLRGQGITSLQSACHLHLSSPLHGVPLCGGERAIITCGLYDSVATPADLQALHRAWPGSTLLEVRQGHFGYRALQETLKEVEKFL